MVIPLFVFHIDAAAGTINESESNDLSTKANLTYDDYDNFGSVNSSDTVDWWKITFTSSGMANFWLGEITADHNIDLYLYKSDRTTQIVQSKRTSNRAEQIRCHVNAATYYIKIEYNSGLATASYKLRIKNYANRSSSLISFDDNIQSGSGIPTSLYSSCEFQLIGLGFAPEDIVNNVVSDVYNTLPNKDILVILSDGSSDGIMPFANGTKLYALSNSAMTSADRALSAFTGNALSETDLIIFAGPNTAGNSTTYGSLVNQAWTEGAYAAIGWMTDVSLNDLQIWLPCFFDYCNNRTVYSVLEATNAYMETIDVGNLYYVTYQDWGSSRLTSLVLDRYY